SHDIHATLVDRCLRRAFGMWNSSVSCQEQPLFRVLFQEPDCPWPRIGCRFAIGAEILIFEEGVSRILIYMRLVALPEFFHRSHCRINGFHDSGVNLPVKSKHSRIDLRHRSLVWRGAIENDSGIQVRHFSRKRKTVSSASAESDAGALAV